MTKRLLAILAVLLFHTAAYADTSSHRQACEELMNVFQIEKMLGPLKIQVKKMQADMVAKMSIPEDMKDISKKHLERVNDLIMNRLSWEQMKDDYVGIYMAVFSEEEIREMVKFYNSPIGKKFVEKSPELMQKVFAMSSKRASDLMPELQQLTKEFQGDLQKEISERRTKEPEKGPMK